GFGNLASRVLAMVGKYYDGVVPAPAEYADADLAIQCTVADAASAADAAIERFAIHEAIAAIWTIVDELNGYITAQEPWALAKDDANRARLGTLLYAASEGLRALAVLLAPVMHQATAKLWHGLGADELLGALDEQRVREAGTWGQLTPGTAIRPLEALFPRIEEAAADADGAA